MAHSRPRVGTLAETRLAQGTPSGGGASRRSRWLAGLAMLALVAPASGASLASEVCPALVVSRQQMLIGGTSLTVDGHPVPAGRAVSALTADGTVAGCVVMPNPGEFRLAVNGSDDTDATDDYPRQGERITLALDGTPIATSAVTVTDASFSPRPSELVFMPGEPASYLLVRVAISRTPSAGATPAPTATATPLPAATSPPAPASGGGGDSAPAAPATATPETLSSRPTAPATVAVPTVVPATPTAAPTRPPVLSGGAGGPVAPTMPVPSLATIPATGGSASLALPQGQPVEIAIAPETMGLMQGTGGPVSLSLRLDPAPSLPNDAAAGSLGGGNVVPAGRPFEIALLGLEGLPSTPGERATLRLPVLAIPPTSDAVFAWLQATYDASGAFLGYVRPPATFDPATNTVLLQPALTELRATLFLPAFIVPAWVQNFDSSGHIYSGPVGEVIDFGVAGPQFTTFTVVAPQVADRIYVFNPASGNYGWIDANIVGPVDGPPTP